MPTEVEPTAAEPTAAEPTAAEQHDQQADPGHPDQADHAGRHRAPAGRHRAPAKRPATKGVTVRFFAAAKAAAGTDEQLRPLPHPSTVGGLADELSEQYGERMAAVLPNCSFLVDGVVARPATPLTGGSMVDVLPPFAGG